MNVLMFGATGMIGQGVLRECLRDVDVHLVKTIARSPGGVTHPKQQEVVHRDLLHLAPIEHELSGFDACFFCLGVTSAGMSEADYERVTYGITVAVGETLARLNPRMTFIFVSGAGADSSEKGRVMWARVKGKAENAVLRLPFKASYVFRPAIVQPLDGIRSRTAAYNILYALTRPLMPLVRLLFRGNVLTTEQMGKAMLIAVRHGAPTRVLESKDINALVESRKATTP